VSWVYLSWFEFLRVNRKSHVDGGGVRAAVGVGQCDERVDVEFEDGREIGDQL